MGIYTYNHITDSPGMTWLTSDYLGWIKLRSPSARFLAYIKACIITSRMHLGARTDIKIEIKTK